MLYFVKLVYINNIRKKKQNTKSLVQTYYQFSMNYVLIQKINEKEIKITP